MSSLPPVWPQELRRLQRRALGVGLLVLVACTIGALFDPAQFYRAYLTAYLFYLGIALGSSTILMLYFLTGGAWGFLIRRILEAAMRTLPLQFVLFVPVAFGLRYLYPWAMTSGPVAGESHGAKQIYFYAPFYWGRQALYFALWPGIAYLLSTWSRRQDQAGDAHLSRKLGRLSALGLVIYGISITFASVDWVMALEPAFRSTVFGPLFASGQILSGQAFAIIVLSMLMAHPGVGKLISPEVLNHLGNLLLTFLVVWAYLAFFQFMIIWIGNLPYEIGWYLRRAQHGWQWVAWSLLILHFAVPFLLLLMRDIKRSPVLLARVAWLVLFMQLVYVYFELMPAFSETNWTEHWMDFLMPLGVGGIWLSYFLRELGRFPLFPLHDENQGSAIHLQLLDREAEAREGPSHA